MFWSDVITLISESTAEKDAEGFAIPGENCRRTVYGNRKSAGANEFYRAAQLGVTIDHKFAVNTDEYHGEQYAEYDGKRYRIIRSYDTGEVTELSLSRHLERGMVSDGKN